MMDNTNLTMLTDFYEFTMANGYLEHGFKDTIAYFDMFFRKVPDGGGYAIMMGVDQLLNYFENLKFEEEDIEYLRSRNIFSDAFLEYLKNFKFECDVWAVKEGTPIFPGEPIVTVRGPVMQAQFVETMVLLTINHQSLIATKSNRIVRAAGGRAVMEFGSRRAQGYNAAIMGARAAYIAGCVGSACAIAERDYNVPALGTMAHSWIQLFDNEYDAFCAYAKTYPDSCTLLVDTYNVLKSGIPNAIKVFDELKAKGHKPVGIRLDSGDLAYLSRKARVMLDEAGHKDCLIFATNDLDEDILLALNTQDAKIDVYGIGTKLITSYNNASLGGVYKLCALEEDGKLVPKIKISNSHEKTTNPGVKKIVRIFKDGMAQADLICLEDETFDTSKPLTIFHPEQTWKKTTFTDYEIKELMVPVFKDGKLVYDKPSLKQICDNEDENIKEFFPEYRRVINTQEYKVDLSQNLWNLKTELLNKAHGQD